MLVICLEGDRIVKRRHIGDSHFRAGFQAAVAEVAEYFRYVLRIFRNAVDSDTLTLFRTAQLEDL